jgi:coniferyl-aldehyde dehydrogenase
MTAAEKLPEASEARRVFALQRDAFGRDSNPSLAIRLARLDALLALLDENGDAIIEAISADFGNRSPHETRLADIMPTVTGLKHAKRHLRGWMQERRLPTALHFLPSQNRLMRQPLGVVGVVSPWNYPVFLALGPALAAIAAGNRVMLKPSEYTPRFAELLRRLVADKFPEDVMAVVTGDADVGREFVCLPFDHLLFTGSTAVGRQVAVAAAHNLTPVTLELGGKSPAIVDPSADLAAAAGSIAFGKMMNAGQTCVAPDYAIVPAASRDAFVEALTASMRRMYPRLADNPDYTSIVTDRHFDRLRALVEDAAAKGGKIVTMEAADANAAAAQRKFQPTIVLEPKPEMRVMQEEIFGPILPVMTYDRIDEAIGAVSSGERPLALYWYGTDLKQRERVLSGTISGGVTVNDCMWHVAQEDAPFGGVGASGIGAYHGEWGFRTFSKEKPVFIQSKLSAMPLMRPPYGKVFEMLTALVAKLI